MPTDCMSVVPRSTQKKGSTAKGKPAEEGFSAKVVHQPQVGTFEPQRPGPEARAVMASTSAVVSKPNATKVQNVPSGKQPAAEKPAKATKVCKR